ncbi:hypothetical protein AAFP30_27755 [Gordonia sp. CPCC 205515]|uniref:hypothetical protein n=1 Tax=Gordonia sp. CPCC 205515 TaxID=3140791 RepID=UPI003AF34EFC
MRYIPSATVTSAATGSVANILWIAADLTVTNPEIADPIREAAAQLIAGGSTTARHGQAAVELAAMIAASRHPNLAGNADEADWATWHRQLTEPWPILADAAATAARIGGFEANITPGRWTL